MSDENGGGVGPGGLPSKLYFRIGEVSQLVGVEPHVLRYWEREFRSIRPSKSAKGQRVYSRRDVENLLRVRELLYAQGFTIAGARKRLLQPAVQAGEALEPEADAERTEGATSEMLPTSHRQRLEELRNEVSAFLRELAPR